MEKFETFLAAKSGAGKSAPHHSFQALRQWAIEHPAEFLEFRSTVASDFLADMRSYARSINPHALMTCNNSLNTPDVLFSQCRNMGYNINGLSKVEDIVTIEDMSSQPRQLPDGRIFEYGPTYKQLHAISHGKPIVACVIADADYTTAPNLVRLAMAEAAANDASYLLWPTWPENVRKNMATSIWPEADFLRQNEKLLNETAPRSDVLLFLCYRRWLQTDQCAVANLATALGRANIQFAVCSEEDLEKSIASRAPKSPVLVVESLSTLDAKEKRAVEFFRAHGGKVVAADDNNWLANVQGAVTKPSHHFARASLGAGGGPRSAKPNHRSSLQSQCGTSDFVRGQKCIRREK